jgi:hypothetical protein
MSAKWFVTMAEWLSLRQSGISGFPTWARVTYLNFPKILFFKYCGEYSALSSAFMKRKQEADSPAKQASSTSLSQAAW